MPPLPCPTGRSAHLARLLLPLALLAGAAAGQDGPPSRELLLELTRTPRLAGTPGSLRAAEFVARELEAAGWTVEIDDREVLLSLPRRLALTVFAEGGSDEPSFARVATFDPDALPTGDIPPFLAWSASGSARGKVVDAGYGTREDFERLESELRLRLRGSIALCRYGRGYRGVKAALAEEFGCAGLLLFSDPNDDGAERGEVWPEGPWKPGWAAQRGSIKPLATTPGDPTTPGWASPPPGVEGQEARRDGEALDAALPQLPCLAIGADDAARILEGLRTRRVTLEDGTRGTRKVGPGPLEVQLEVDAPRELRTIRNVIGWLPGEEPGLVLAGNHRDAWVRGAHDAGGGTVALLRAAQHLGERKRAGWTPRRTLGVAFWDGEETGLFGSTEWVEGRAEELVEQLVLYVNADAAVSGTQFRCSGTPGLERFVADALNTVEDPRGQPVAASWVRGGELPVLGMPGSGSDYTAFLHHLNLPVLDLSFQGNSGGQYHTQFDDFSMMERYLDPGFVGHELAGRTVAALLVEAAERGATILDEARAARVLGDHARVTGSWLGEERAGALGDAFEALASAIENAGSGDRPTSTLYRALRAPEGLAGRPWFRNRLWAPALEKGYGAETFPGLRAAQAEPERLDEEYAALLAATEELAGAWRQSAQGAGER